LPRNGSGIFSVPAGTQAVTGDTIASAPYNAFIADLESDLNAARPVSAGGTGATSASAARTALGLAIGVDVMAYSADISALATAWTPASASAAASLAFAEDTDNGAHKVTVTAPAAVAADATVTLPGVTTTLVGTADVASAANFQANTADKILDTDGVWSAAAEVTLTDGVTITPDMSTFINAVVTLGGNRTMASPTNAKTGQSGYIRIVQDATGSRTLSYGANWEFAGGTAPVLSTAAAAQDMLFYQVIASNRVLGSLVKAVV